MANAQIVQDLEASPLSESSSPSGAPIVEDLKASLQCELHKLWGIANEAENFTIFRTPRNISQNKENLFEPSVISIGPFHHGKEHLRALEEQKWRFLRDFLSPEDHILDQCISEIKSQETRARRCYSETFDGLDSNAFVKMMLLDGCFVLQYFKKLCDRNRDSVYEVGWNSTFVDHDLLLLENQIPFFIVKKLHNIGFPREDAMNFFTDQLVRNFKDRKLLPNSIKYRKPEPLTEIHHLGHLFYHCFVPDPDDPVVKNGFLHWFCSMVIPKSTADVSNMVIPSATELKQKGLKFEEKRKPKHMLDISFEYGVLKIPRLIISDDTKPIFANLVGFENSKYRKKDSPFTSFVIFLDNLVNTQNDVNILQECGIIENWLGSEENLVHFINQVTQGGALGDGHYLAKLNEEVNIYSGSSWNRQRAKLVRDYFSSPWAAISLIAAFILLVLTCVQSFYAVYAYKFPPRS